MSNLERHETQRQATAAFLRKCQRAPDQEEFPLKQLLRLAKRAGLSLGVSLRVPNRGARKCIILQAETVASHVLHGYVKISETEDAIMFQSDLFGKLKLNKFSGLYPMMSALASLDAKHNPPQPKGGR